MDSSCNLNWFQPCAFIVSSMEQMLDRRRKMIVKSMLKKETETAATQTGLAGVPQVAKIKEPREVLCSVCARQSLCQWCTEVQEKEPSDTPEITKLRRTQDILLAYKPCYVVATASEETRSPRLHPIGARTEKIEIPNTAQLHVAPCATSKKTNTSTIDDMIISKENVQVKNSICGWTHVVNDTLAKSWSLKGSASNEIVTTAASSVATACDKKSSRCVPSSEAALQVLKNTFCTRDTCSAVLATLEKRHSIDKGVSEKVPCDLANCALLNKSCRQLTDAQICARPRVNKLKIPTQPLSENYLRLPI